MFIHYLLTNYGSNQSYLFMTKSDACNYAKSKNCRLCHELDGSVLIKTKKSLENKNTTKVIGDIKELRLNKWYK